MAGSTPPPPRVPQNTEGGRLSQKRGEKSCLMPSRRDEVFRGLPKISGRAGADVARRLHRRCLGKGAACAAITRRFFLAPSLGKIAPELALIRSGERERENRYQLVVVSANGCFNCVGLYLDSQNWVTSFWLWDFGGMRRCEADLVVPGSGRASGGGRNRAAIPA